MSSEPKQHRVINTGDAWQRGRGWETAQASSILLDDHSIATECKHSFKE